MFWAEQPGFSGWVAKGGREEGKGVWAGKAGGHWGTRLSLVTAQCCCFYCCPGLCGAGIQTTHLCQPHPTNTTSGPMTGDTWAPRPVCPGAEVRQGGRRRQESRMTRPSEVEHSWTQEQCGSAGLLASAGDKLGSRGLTCYVFSFRKT